MLYKEWHDIFWIPDNQMFQFLEKKSLEVKKINEHEDLIKYNYARMKLDYLRYFFRSWDFEEEMHFQATGGLDKDSYDKLLRLHPILLRELADSIFDYALSEEASEKIERQSHLLFSKNGSVANPHEMISLYCELTEMWSKFGLNYFDLQNMPIYEKNALRKILAIENQTHSAELRKLEAKNTNKGGRR